MPLHDWRDDRGWDSLHLVRQNQLLDWVQPRLPEGYRAYLGSVPALTIDIPNDRPHLSVRTWTDVSETRPQPLTQTSMALDTETVVAFTLDPQHAIRIDPHGSSIAAVELVSPRHKDRPAARDRYLGRYLSYIHRGIHLLLIDVLPRPTEFSFAEAMETNLAWSVPVCRAPFAVSYRVGEPVPEGTIPAIRRRAVQVGETLPTIPLALSPSQEISIDLEHTYAQSARRVYLS